VFKVPAPDDEWLNAFLTVRPPTDGPLSWFSTFSAVVRDAREVTGRHLDTGEVENDARAGNWLGAVAYLIFLDQIGDCFEPDPILRPPAENTAAIVRALTYFEPSLSDDDILAIYALRCALIHDYSLVNIGRGRRADRLHHRFVLVNSASLPLVERPPVAWDGELGSSTYRMQTTVNARRVGDVGENVLKLVQRVHADRRLRIRLPGGIDELVARFTCSMWPDTPGGD
jgi:hypothetical protein